MRLRTVLLLVVFVATAALIFINRQVFSARANINFLFGSIEMPIGAAALGLVAVVILVFTVYVAIWQGAVLMDYRRQSKVLQAQRKLAEDAEASRFTELGALLREEMSKLDARLDASVEALRAEVRDSGNSIAATLGEMDDRLQRWSNRGNE